MNNLAFSRNNFFAVPSVVGGWVQTLSRGIRWYGLLYWVLARILQFYCHDNPRVYVNLVLQCHVATVNTLC